jgi:cobalt-zinc-cadmium efflux system protein
MAEHNHDRDRATAREAGAKAMRTALLITLLFVGIEIAGGLWSGSLALLADAGHMLSDAAALGLALFATWLSARPRSAERTFGWRRFEIFAAFLNGAFLWIVAIRIGLEAVERFSAPRPVAGTVMLVSATAGLAANLAAAAVLYRNRRANLNIRGTFLHVVGDALGSVGAIAAAVVISLTGWLAADPLTSLFIAALIVFGSAKLVRDSFHILMEGAPAHLQPAEIRGRLLSIEGVADVHDFHIWTVGSGFVSLSAHLVVGDGADSAGVFREARDLLRSRYAITHATLQLENAGGGLVCETDSCDAEGSPFRRAEGR